MPIQEIKDLLDDEGLVMVPDATEGFPAWLRTDVQTLPVIVTAVLERTAVCHPPRDFCDRLTATLDDLLADPAQVPIARPQYDPRSVAAANGRARALQGRMGPDAAAAAADRQAEGIKRQAVTSTHSGKPMTPALLRRIDELRAENRELRPLAELGRQARQLVSGAQLDAAAVCSELRRLAIALGPDAEGAPVSGAA